LEQYNVTGMSCAACSARVEKAVSKLEGVTSCSVSLLTNSMGVEGNASEKDILEAVEKAGYHASKKDSKKTQSKQGTVSTIDNEFSTLKARLLSSILFLAILMYFSMGHSMFGFPLPDFFEENYIAQGIVQLILSGIVIIINQRFFVSGFKAVINKSPNMDTLVALGSGASMVYSIYALLAMTRAVQTGNHALVHSYYHDFYFESAAMILALITVGKMLEAHSKGKTTNALQSLLMLKPQTATVLVDNRETIIPVDDLKIGDIFVVKTGESIPIDGVIIEGSCAINEAALTGESIPIDKKEGDCIYGATLNQSGYIKCRATKTNEDTTLAQIIKMVSEASATKAPIAKVADKVSGLFVPIVICIAIITAIVWLTVGETFGFALARAISVLVISCPCALGLATPVAIMVGNGVGAKHNILFKTATALEEAGRMNIIVLDKTGTITTGTPVVTDILPYGSFNENELLSLAYSLEIKSEHPLATAIVNKAKEQNIRVLDTSDFTAVPGNGLSANIDGNICYGGNHRYLSKIIDFPQNILESSQDLSKQGKTPLFFAQGKTFAGIIAVADSIRTDSPKAIKELQDMGLYVVMLTGDNKNTANAIQQLTGVDEVIAEVLPSGKEDHIRRLKEKGKVAMAGDGINDALALTSADIGIAIGAGTDVAIDAADIVLMKNSLMDVPALIRLSRATLKNIYENLFWAFIYNVIGIPLAAGIWIPIFGLKLNPMFGAAAMSLSSFCVVTNALRLNLISIRSTVKDKKYKKTKNEKENKMMEKNIKIEGMMCGHCEARVKKCLEEIEGVKEAIVSHETGTATVISDTEIPDEVLKKVVEDQGYTVV